MIAQTQRTRRPAENTYPIDVRLFHSSGPITFVWLLIRLWLGGQWVLAGLEKLRDPGWLNGQGLAGFWHGALATQQGPHPGLAYAWYADFLRGMLANHAETWFAGLVAGGEVLVGVGLILGLFTGFSALVAGFMNFNYMLAGSASVNPVFFVLALVLLLAWRWAGFWGLDRFVLPALRHGIARRPSVTFRTRSPQAREA
ncbi:MAG: DoxX family membrane protein [Candidatus Dormibacteraeota bacterium]|nr:DoxX family membrane protein [Candidatus Dormibacteraeota bacterium]